jgi:hypothetical protein
VGFTIGCDSNAYVLGESLGSGLGNKTGLSVRDARLALGLEDGAASSNRGARSPVMRRLTLMRELLKPRV